MKPISPHHPSTPTSVGSEGPNTPSSHPLSDSKSHELNSPTTSFKRKRGAKSPHTINDPPPAPRAPPKCFWLSSVQEMPIYHQSPWDFYDSFLSLGSNRILALCNHGAERRVIRSGVWDLVPVFQIQHRNFIQFYGIYLFEGQAFVVSEYIDFSLQEILQNDICPIEPEIRYITSQVLVGIRFVQARRVEDIAISARSIWVSHEGNVKIDPTIRPIDDEQTSADMSCLGALVLTLMNETRQTFRSATWSAEAVDFVEATSWATADELSEHVFLASPAAPKLLGFLCIASGLKIKREIQPLGAFAKRFGARQMSW